MPHPISGKSIIAACARFLSAAWPSQPVPPGQADIEQRAKREKEDLAPFDMNCGDEVRIRHLRD
jgi:hypothetical protein